MVEKRRNTAPPITPTKIWTFGEVLFSVLGSAPEPGVECGVGELEAFFSEGVSFGTGEGGEGSEGFSCGGLAARLRGSSWARWNDFRSCSRPRVVPLPWPICL